MPIPALGSNPSAPYWVVWYSQVQGVSSRLTGTTTQRSYQIIQASTSQGARRNFTASHGAGNPVLGVDGPYQTSTAAHADAQKTNQAIAKSFEAGSIPNPFSWLGSIAGDIASGIEQGVVSTLSDIWRVTASTFAIAAGFVVLAIGLVFFFKDDLMNIIKLAAVVAK